MQPFIIVMADNHDKKNPLPNKPVLIIVGTSGYPVHNAPVELPPRPVLPIAHSGSLTR